jgi:hypothetical protein
MVEKRGEEKSSPEATEAISKDAEALKPKGFLKKNRRNKAEETNPKKIIYESTKKKIDYVLSKSEIKEEEVYELVKGFFKEYLKLDYEFTNQELMEELKKVYLEKELLDQLEDFLKKMALIESFDNNFSPAELRKMLTRFDGMIKELIGPIEEQKKKSLFGGMLESLKNKKKAKKSQIEQKEEKLREKVKEESKTGSAPSMSAASCQKKIRELLKLIKRKIRARQWDEAKKIYMDLLNVYENADKVTKHKYYDLIYNLYSKLAV